MLRAACRACRGVLYSTRSDTARHFFSCAKMHGLDSGTVQVEFSPFRACFCLEVAMQDRQSNFICPDGRTGDMIGPSHEVPILR